MTLLRPAVVLTLLALAVTGCGASSGQPGITPIHAVQGAEAASPLVGDTVTIEGIVTGVDDEIGASFARVFPGDAGIFVQEEPDDADADAASSEGVFVGFVRPRSAYPPGTVVRLTGEVLEQFGETRIALARGTTPERRGRAPVPAPVTIDPVRAAAQDARSRPYYESLEGMDVRLAVGTATAGGRNKFGETFLTPGVRRAEEDRVLRGEPAPDLIAADADAGAGDPDNPLVDTGSSTELPADLFDVVRRLRGPLGFSFGHFKVLPQPGGPRPTVSNGPIRYPYAGLAPRGRDELRVASFNVQNLFGVGARLDRERVTAAAYAAKRDRVVDAIGDLLERPDVVGLQEVATQAEADDLARRLGGYTAYLREGNDTRGIDVAVLVRDTLRVSAVRQLGRRAREDVAADCSDAEDPLTFDRPPLQVTVRRGGTRFAVLVNHFASKAAPDACRAVQAAYVRDRAAALRRQGEEVVVLGDLNSFEDEVALRTLQEGGLVNLWSRAPAAERYSFQFDGRLQTLDHVLVSPGLARRVRDVRYAHIANDYYDRRRRGDGHRASDHDPVVVTLR